LKILKPNGLNRIHIKSFNTGQKNPDYPEPQEHGDFKYFKFWDKECLDNYPDSDPDPDKEKKVCFKKKITCSLLDSRTGDHGPLHPPQIPEMPSERDAGTAAA
jgi:hypothetical protein